MEIQDKKSWDLQILLYPFPLVFILYSEYQSQASKPYLKAPKIPGGKERGQNDRTECFSWRHLVCLNCSPCAAVLSTTFFLLSLDSFCCFFFYFSHFLHLTTTGLSMSRLYPPHLFINKIKCKVFVSNNVTEDFKSI